MAEGTSPCDKNTVSALASVLINSDKKYGGWKECAGQNKLGGACTRLLFIVAMMPKLTEHVQERPGSQWIRQKTVDMGCHVRWCYTQPSSRKCIPTDNQAGLAHCDGRWFCLKVPSRRSVGAPKPVALHRDGVSGKTAFAH